MGVGRLVHVQAFSDCGRLIIQHAHAISPMLAWRVSRRGEDRPAIRIDSLVNKAGYKHSFIRNAQKKRLQTNGDLGEEECEERYCCNVLFVPREIKIELLLTEQRAME
jgi:hypothetical protein